MRLVPSVLAVSKLLAVRYPMRLKLQSMQTRYLSIDTFSAPHATVIRGFPQFAVQVFLQDPSAD